MKNGNYGWTKQLHETGGLSYCRKLCGDHIQFDDGDAQIDEIVHSKEGSYVDESGDQPCRDHNNEHRNPGDTWLTEDSCNVCSCKGKPSPVFEVLGLPSLWFTEMTEYVYLISTVLRIIYSPDWRSIN